MDASPGNRRMILVVAGVILAVGVGLLIGRVAFAAPETDIELACTSIDALPDDESVKEMLDEFDATKADRLLAIGSHARAAEGEDSGFAKSGERIMRGIMSNDMDEADEALEDLREQCDGQ
ncbi:hypothetical protein [Nocardioides sp. Root151]|uniref:hypothetical protein n=1 Tax=Nocardioides sp. Root151 TaxID=1736475 RepID=UPI0012E3BB77|nr:hypothetical protein [Nocardioides sp. Root151]